MKGTTMKRSVIRFISAMVVVTALCPVAAFVSCEKEETRESSESRVQFVTDPSEPDLGEYTVSERGIRLYYDAEKMDAKIVDTIERYFIALSERDYETYESFTQADYRDAMNKYLEKEYGYDLKTSFKNQCDNLEKNAGGTFAVTRVKADYNDKEEAKTYIDNLGELFGDSGFYDKIKEKSDAIHDIIFYIMAECDGEESLLLSDYEIVLSEEDGKYYIFG